MTPARRAGQGAGAAFALTVVTMAAVVGFGRLFSDWSFLLPALAAAALSHGLGWACRRLRLNAVTATITSGIGLIVFLAWVLEPQTTTFGLPGADTWSAIQTDLSAAWNQFARVVAPTPTTSGFTLATATGAWLAAWLADLFAFRARVRVEALIPSFTVFLFGAMLGTDRHRVALAALYFGAVLAFMLTADPADLAPGHAWLGTPSTQWSRRGRRLVRGGWDWHRSGAIIGLAAVAGALVIGPRLPGATAEALVSWKDKDKSAKGSRITVSPLVDIRGRLVNQPNTEVFSVASTDAAYWRLTSLDHFDGTIWSSRGSYQRAHGDLADGVTTGGAEAALRQEFTITALSSIWLPAAFRPARLVSRVGGLRYDADTASLLTDQPTSDMLHYVVESSRPRLSAEQLAGVDQVIPPAVATRYLALPPSFPGSVAAQARRAVAGAGSPYAMAKALQDWFRTNFSYNLDIPAGHGDRAMQEFLARREGYCEQFAGTYAAMARSLGIPARVAVGFTAGTRDDKGNFRVSGRNAHAWPEVYLSGYGWVAFEPTPGRGQPGAESYTGVAPVNDAGSPQPEGGTGATQPTVTTAPAVTPTTVAGGKSLGASTTPATTPSRHSKSRAISPAWFVAILLAMPTAGGGAVVAAKAIRRRRRWAQAASPAAQVLAAWHDADDALGMLGLSRLHTETPAEHARRFVAAGRATRYANAQEAVAISTTSLAELAQDVTEATWSSDGLAESVAARARSAAGAVTAGLRKMATRRERLRWALDPRPLFKRPVIGQDPTRTTFRGGSAFEPERLGRRRGPATGEYVKPH